MSVSQKWSENLIKSILFSIAIMTAFAAETVHAQTYKTATEARIAVSTNCSVIEAHYVESSSSYKVVRSGWTGGCLDGLLHGFGMRTIEFILTGSTPTGILQNINQQSGQMVRGKMVGPWLIHKAQTRAFEGIYTWVDAPISGNYRKESDGSFQHVQYAHESRTMQPVLSTARIPEAEVIAHIKAALINNTANSPNKKIRFQSTLLQDLIKSGEIYKATDTKLGDISKKRIVLVNSTNTLDSFDALAAFQRTVQNWSNQQPNIKVRQAGMELANAANSKKIIEDVNSVLVEKFSKVSFSEDFTSINKAETDYILVFDLTFKHDAKNMLIEQEVNASQEAGQKNASKNDSALQIRGGVSYFLLNNKLEVVKSNIQNLKTQDFVKASKWTWVNGSQEDKIAEGIAHALKFSTDLMLAYYGGQRYYIVDGKRSDNLVSVTWDLRKDLVSD
jgi:hypothetical protein